jgi:hypothetical protein
MTGKVPVARVQGMQPSVPYQPRGRKPSRTSRPWQDRRTLIAERSTSRNLAHGFPVPDFHALRETMKEDRNVRYSFSRDRLGWKTPQT